MGQAVPNLGIFAAGYLARPLGGILMAHTGDLRGRKQMFTLSIFLMGLSTLTIGFLPTYVTIGVWAPILLLICRMLQGAAVGGEVPGAWVFVGEHVPPSRAGLACGTLTAGLTAGILLGSLVATGVNLVVSQSQLATFGWRIPFLLGGAFGLLSVYLRRLLTETPVFEELRSRRKLASELPLKAILRDHRPAVLLSGMLTWILSAAIVVVILMTPALLEKVYHVKAIVASKRIVLLLPV
jgi:MFS family permease